jgi:glycosyltransferase involved in cell wall biosynthesis
MTPLKVLLVSYSFPPAGGVGVLRAASLARYLPGEGIRLDVLTASKPSAVGADPSLLLDIPDQVTIHRTLALDLPFTLKKRIKAFLSGSKPRVAPAIGAAASERPGVVRRLIQDILLPDPQVTWLPVLNRAARRIIRTRNIDLVLITVPPFSSVGLVGNLRRRFPHLPIVLEFRDEWLSTGIELFGFSQSQRARTIARQMEAAAVTNATTVVAVTEAARREIRARFPDEPEGKFELIPNGFDATRLWLPAAQTGSVRSDKIVIAHVGTVYRTSDPTALIEALKSLPAEVAARVQLRFIGHIEEQRFRDALLQLGAMVELQGFLPQREALALMEEADYVLLISHDPVNVGAKFYDYLGGGKPILAVIRPDSELRTLIEDLRAGWWAPMDDVKATCQLFVDAVARGRVTESELRRDNTRIAQYERKALAGRYARLLDSIASAAEQSQLAQQGRQADRGGAKACSELQ